jgi:hypothetical protein
VQRPTGDDEFNDAFDLFEENGYLWDEFLIQRVPYPPLHDRPAPAIADVIVSQPGYSIEKTYTADGGESWLGKLADDLRSGEYGPKIGRRRVRIWDDSEWVKVSSHPSGARQFSVHSDSGAHFGIEANTDAELVDRIGAQLRRLSPEGK